MEIDRTTKPAMTAFIKGNGQQLGQTSRYLPHNSNLKSNPSITLNSESPIPTPLPAAPLNPSVYRPLTSSSSDRKKHPIQNPHHSSHNQHSPIQNQHQSVQNQQDSVQQPQDDNSPIEIENYDNNRNFFNTSHNNPYSNPTPSANPPANPCLASNPPPKKAYLSTGQALIDKHKRLNRELSQQSSLN